MDESSSGLQDKLRSIGSRLKEGIAEINERSEQREQAHVREAEERQQQAEQLGKELDAKTAENRAAREDPNSKNEWLNRRDGGERTMDFGPGADDDPAGAQQSTQPVAQPAPSQQTTVPTPLPGAEPAQSPAKPRRPRRDEDDDEDFANRDWFV